MSRIYLDLATMCTAASRFCVALEFDVDIICAVRFMDSRYSAMIRMTVVSPRQRGQRPQGFGTVDSGLVTWAQRSAFDVKVPSELIWSQIPLLSHVIVGLQGKIG